MIEARAFWVVEAGRGEVRVERLADPGPGEVLVEALASGISRGMAASLYNTSRDVGNISSPILGGLVASAVGLGGMFMMVPPLTVAAALGTVGVLELRSRRVARGTAEAV